MTNPSPGEALETQQPQQKVEAPKPKSEPKENDGGGGEKKNIDSEASAANNQPEDSKVASENSEDKIEDRTNKNTGEESSNAETPAALKEELNEATNGTLQELTEFYLWSESHDIKRIAENSHLQPDEKIDQILEIMVEDDLSKNKPAENLSEAELEETKDKKKKEAEDKIKKIKNQLSVLVTRTLDWSLESVNEFLSHDVTRIFDILFGDYFGRGTGGVGEGLSGTESKNDIISPNEFFSQISRNPKDTAAKLERSYKQLSQLGWQLGQEGERMLKLASKASNDRAREILQLLMVGIPAEDSGDSLDGDSLISFLTSDTEGKQNYKWQQASGIISQEVFGQEKIISPEIKDLLKDMADGKEKPQNYFND